MFGLFGKSAPRKMAISSRHKKTPLLPAKAQTFIAHRLTDAYGAFFALSGSLLLLSLISYNPADPSLNTTAGDDVIAISNWMGTAGAYAADLLLQTLGVAAYLIPAALLVWGYRVLKRLPFGRIGMKLTLMLLGVMAAAIVFARIPSFDSWGHGAYLGGSAGTLIFAGLGQHLQGWLGAMAYIFIAVTAAVAFVFAYGAALGLSVAEWRELGARILHVLALGLHHVRVAIARFRRWHREASTAEVRHVRPLRGRRPRMTAANDADEDEDADEEEAEYEEEEEEERPAAALARRKPVITARAEKAKPAAREEKQKKLALKASDEEWQLPPLDFLGDPPAGGQVRLDESALQKNAEMLQATLGDFGVQGDILKVSPGPIVTLYEMEPAPGTKTSRVVGLADDIARSMSAVSARIAAVPGKNAIGIELPNAKRETVYLKELLASAEYAKNPSRLPLVLGKNISGDPIIADLARMPHLLVAGTTGSGKSVAVNTMILSLLYKLSPAQCRFIMIDPKMLELSVYDDIPHLLTPVVTEPHRAVTALKWAVSEMEDRYRAMSKLGVRNIDGFNDRIRSARDAGEVLLHKVQTGFDADTGKPVYEEQPIPLVDLPYIVVIVDEFADLMLVAGKEVENAIQRLAQMARAAGIHLIMATQRPSVDVITGVIKANFPTRISFQVTSKIDSRTILGDGGAEQLLGQGDMLYMASGGRIGRVHGPFCSDAEVEKVVNHLKAQEQPSYVDGVTDGDEGGGDFGGGYGGGGGEADALYDQAVAIVLRERKVSTSFIQRHLQIGYNRAARIVERMEKEGLVSAANHVGKREILVGDYGT
jgi:S-DNA-T family DNA segregation ATPase FtsK/SpoIIIE